MVVAAVFNHYWGSDRGLTTRRDIAASGISATDWYHLPLHENPSSSTLDYNSSMNMIPATKPKRKRCRASKFLASVAADLDVVTDWVFFFHTCELVSIFILEIISQQ